MIVDAREGGGSHGVRESLCDVQAECGSRSVWYDAVYSGVVHGVDG